MVVTKAPITRKSWKYPTFPIMRPPSTVTIAVSLELVVLAWRTEGRPGQGHGIFGKNLHVARMSGRFRIPLSEADTPPMAWK